MISVQSYCFELMKNFLSSVSSLHIGQRWDVWGYRCLLLKLLLLGWAGISVGLLCESSVLLGYYIEPEFLKKQLHVMRPESRWWQDGQMHWRGCGRSLRQVLWLVKMHLCNWEWWSFARIFIFFEEEKIILNFINGFAYRADRLFQN